jgi:HEAT repeat protein
VLVAPSDRHASQLLNEMKRYATEGNEGVRLDAVNLLAQIADEVPSRRDEIRGFLVLLSDARDQVLAERARAAVESMLEKRREQTILKIGEQ